MIASSKKKYGVPGGRNSSYSHRQNQGGRVVVFANIFGNGPVSAMYSIYPGLKKKSMRLATLPPCRKRVCSTRCELGSGGVETSDIPDEPDDSTPVMLCKVLGYMAGVGLFVGFWWWAG